MALVKKTRLFCVSETRPLARSRLVHDAQLQERSAFGCRICALVIQTVVPASRVTKMPLQQELTMRNYIVLYAPELAQAENYLSLTFA